MDEQYIATLYGFLSDYDKEFSKNITVEDFNKKVSSNEEYVSTLYSFLSDYDKEFSKNITIKDFTSKLGFIDPSDIELETTIPSPKDYEQKYKDNEITHQEYLMLKSKDQEDTKGDKATKQQSQVIKPFSFSYEEKQTEAEVQQDKSKDQYEKIVKNSSFKPWDFSYNGNDEGSSYVDYLAQEAKVIEDANKEKDQRLNLYKDKALIDQRLSEIESELNNLLSKGFGSEDQISELKKERDDLNKKIKEVDTNKISEYEDITKKVLNLYNIDENLISDITKSLTDTEEILLPEGLAAAEGTVADFVLNQDYDDILYWDKSLGKFRNLSSYRNMELLAKEAGVEVEDMQEWIKDTEVLMAEKMKHEDKKLNLEEWSGHFENQLIDFADKYNIEGFGKDRFDAASKMTSEYKNEYVDKEKNYIYTSLDEAFKNKDEEFVLRNLKRLGFFNGDVFYDNREDVAAADLEKILNQLGVNVYASAGESDDYNWFYDERRDNMARLSNAITISSKNGPPLILYTNQSTKEAARSEGIKLFSYLMKHSSVQDPLLLKDLKQQNNVSDYAIQQRDEDYLNYQIEAEKITNDRAVKLQQEIIDEKAEIEQEMANGVDFVQNQIKEWIQQNPNATQEEFDAFQKQAFEPLIQRENQYKKYFDDNITEFKVLEYELGVNRNSHKKAMLQHNEMQAKKGTIESATVDAFLTGTEAIVLGGAKLVNDLTTYVNPLNYIYAWSQGEDASDEIDKYLKDFNDDIANSRGFLTDLGPNTRKEYLQAAHEDFWYGSYLGVIQSAPAMMLSAITGGAGGVAAFGFQQVEYLNEEFYNDPDLRKLSEAEKWTIMLPTAVVAGVLEEVGFGKWALGRGGNRLISEVTLETLATMPKNFSRSTFKKIALENFDNKILNGVVKISKAGVLEYETGFLQQTSEATIKEIYGYVKGKDVFDTSWDKPWHETLYDFNYAGMQEAVGGKMMATPKVLFQTSIDYSLGKKSTDNQFSYIEAMVKDKKSIVLMKEALRKEFLQGKSTEKQYNEAVAAVDQASGIFRDMPSNLDLQDRKKAYDLVQEKNRLQGKSKLNTVEKNRIKEIDETLTSMSEFAENNKQKTRVNTPLFNSAKNNTDIISKEEVEVIQDAKDFLVSETKVSKTRGTRDANLMEMYVNKINDIAKNFKDSGNTTKKSLAAELDKMSDFISNRATSLDNTISIGDPNLVRNGKTQKQIENLYSANVELVDQNYVGETVYFVNNETISAREFDAKMKDKTFLQELKNGQSSVLILGASLNAKEKYFNKLNLDPETKVTLGEEIKMQKNIEAAKVVAEKMLGKELKEGENYSVVENQKDYKTILQQYGLKGKKLKEALESDAFISDDGFIVINKETSQKLSPTSFTHEVLHKILDTNFNKSSKEEQKKIIKEFLNTLDSKTLSLVNDRIKNNYGGEVNEETQQIDLDKFAESGVTLDEFLTSFSDLITTGKIKYNKNLFEKIKDWFKRILGSEMKNIAEIKDGKQAFEFVKNYSESVLRREGAVKVPFAEKKIVKEEVKKKEVVEVKKKTTTEPTTEKSTTPTGELGMYDADIGVQREGGEDVSSEIEEKEVVSEKITWPKIKAGIPDGKGGTLQTTGKTGDYKLIRTDQDGKPEILGTFNTLDGSIARANEYIGLKSTKKTTKKKTEQVVKEGKVPTIKLLDVTKLDKQDKQTTNASRGEYLDHFITQSKDWLRDYQDLKGTKEYKKVEKNHKAAAREFVKGKKSARFSKSKPGLRFSLNLSKDQVTKANKDMKSFMNDLYKESSSMWNDGGSDYVMDILTQNKVLDKFIVNLVRRTVAQEKPPGWDSESEADLIQQTYIELIPHIRNFNKDFHDFKADAIENDNFWGWVNPYIKKKLYNSFKKIGLKPAFEADVTEAKDIAYEEEQVTTIDKIEKSLRKELGLNDEFRNRVLDKVKAIFKGKLPHPSSPEFKTKLEKEFETALFDVIREDLFGAKFNEEKNRYMYDWGLIQERLDQYAEIIYDKLPIQTLVSLNRTTWKKGELIMKPVIDPSTGEQKRMLPEESDRSRELFGYEVKDREAGNLVWTKQNSSAIKEDFINFFLNPIVSRKAMRMEGLFKVLAKEIAFDATMETVNNPEVYERMQDLYELQGINLLGNELEIIAKEIDRSPGLRFSTKIKEVSGIPIEELQKASILEYGQDYFSDASILTKLSDEVIPDIASKKYKINEAIKKYPNLNGVLKILYNSDPEAFSPKSERENAVPKINDNIEDNINNGNFSNSKDLEMLNKAKNVNASQENTEKTHDLIIDSRKYMSNDLRTVLGKSITTFFKNIFSFTHTTRASRLTNIINDNKKFEEFNNKKEFKGEKLSESDVKLIEKFNPLISNKGIINKVTNILLFNESISKIKEDLSKINFTEINRANGRVFELILENLYSTLYSNRNKIDFLNNEWVGFVNYIKGQSQVMDGLKSLVSLDFMEIKRFVKKNIIKFKGVNNIKRRINRAYDSQKPVVEGLLKNKKQISNPNKSKDGTYISNGWKYGVEDKVKIKIKKNGRLSNIKEEITTEPNVYVNSKSEQKLYEDLEEAWNNVKNKKKLLFEGEVKTEELSDAWLDYRKLRDEVVAHHIKVLPRQKLKNGKYERISDVKGQKYNLPNDITGSKGNRKGDLVDNVARDINELDIVISEEAIKFQLEHMNAISKGFSEIMITFSRGLSNDMKLNLVKNDISDIVRSLTAGLFEKSTSEKLDSKLSPTTPLGDIRIFILENFKDIHNTTGLNSISESKDYLIAKQFLNNINNAKRKVKTKNDNLIKSSKVVKVSESMSNEDILSLAATMDAALDLARNPDTPVKKIRVFDFDDTLAQTKSNVLYTMPDGTKGKLTAEEFAQKGSKMVAKGAVLDFSEFNKVVDGKKGPLFEIAERIQKARGTEDVFVLTARSQEAAPAIKEFLDSIGLNIPLKNITGLGNSSPYAKSQWVIEKAAEGYNDFYFADDHAKNVQAVQDALDQLTDVKARTQIAIVGNEAATEEENMNTSINSPTDKGSDGLLNIRFSKKSRELYIKQLTKRRKDLTPQQVRQNVAQVFRFVDNLDVPQNKKKKFEKLTLHYLANSNLILPEDGYKVIMAEKIAKQNKFDPFSYKNPNEIMALAPEKIEDESFNPDDQPAFKNKKELPEGVTIYDVENTKEGQHTVRAAIDASFGRKANPWCLAARVNEQVANTIDEYWENQGIYWMDNREYDTKAAFVDEMSELKAQGATVIDESYMFDGKKVYNLHVKYDKSKPHPDHDVMFDDVQIDEQGVPIQDDDLGRAFTFFKGYGSNKKIAFQNGKLVALRDGTKDNAQVRQERLKGRWWDKMDKPHNGIPVKRKRNDWTEYITVKANGSAEVLYMEKGNPRKGKFIQKKPDGTIIQDILIGENGKPMSGIRVVEMSEGNTSTQQWEDGKLIRTLDNYAQEFIANNLDDKILFDGKEISVKIDKYTREDYYDGKGNPTETFVEKEGVDKDGNKIVFNELLDPKIAGSLYPIRIFKEFNGEKYLTQWDLNINELIKKVAREVKELEGDQLKAEYLKTEAASLMSSALTSAGIKDYNLTEDNLRAAVKNYKLDTGKAALNENDKNIIIPVDEEGNSLRFSMNTRMDLTWKKKSTKLDFLNYTMDTHTTTFTLDGNEYEIKMVKMLQEEAASNLGQVTAPEGDYYDVSFAYIDENGVPHIDITGKAGKKSGSVISIITNGVLDFVRNNKVDGLTYSSKEVNRTKLYNTLTNLFASELGWGKRVNEVTFDPMAVDPELEGLYADLGSLYNNLVSDAQSDFTEFTVSKHLPVKKDLTNQRKPVRDVMRTIDKGSPTQSHNIRFSKSNLNKTFNHIIEAKTGIAAEKTFDEVAKGIGKKKGKGKFFMPYSAEDFIGLMYPLLSKGKLGDKQMEWFNTVLFKPFARAMENVSKDRNQIMRDFRELKKNLKNVPKNLRKEAIPGLTYENAVRIYLWDKQGFTVPGLHEDTMSKVWELMQEQPELQAFADQLLAINKGDGFAKPDQTWMAGTITTDLLRGLNTTKRKKYLDQWQRNVDIIFSKENLLKLEAAYGYKYVEALKDSLRRMKTGVNKKTGGSRLENLWLDWVNNSVGVTMFLNSRSALLQTISAVNFVNWSDNNPLKAGKAFANQPQYWKDFMMLMNSEFLVDRRSGLRINVSESEIADAAATSTNKVRGVVNLLLQKGFVMTQFADSFAIASGGATFYRNRLNTYLKQGLEQKEAEQKAFQDFRELAEESQQSSRPDRISMQQASGIGRVILAFANTPMQYNRLIKKAFLDLKHGRGDRKANISRILYYGFIQNVIFNALQQALFALAFDDEEEDEKKKKYYKVANGMLDSILRGMGYAGAAIATVKNMGVKFYEESQKDRPKYENVTWEVLNISPPIDAKITKIRAAFRTLDYEMDEIKEQGFSIDQPAYMSVAQVFSAFTNIPVDRLLRKAENVEAAVNEDYEVWQRTALFLGYSEWQIQTQEQKAKEKKEKEEGKALRDPSRYNKNQQVDVLKQFNLTDSEIDKLNTEEKRVDKIKQLEKQEGKQYKPRVEKEKRLSTEEKYKKATKGLTKKEVQVFDKLEEIYALNKTEQVAIIMKKEGLTKKWVNGKYKTEVDRVKKIYEIEHSKNDNAYKKWSEYRKRDQKPKQDKEKVDADALYEEIF